MRASPGKKTWHKVLRFTATKASQATVRRYYEEYRREAGLLPRCDNEACVFHRDELRWNGVPLPLILDHKNGVSRDSSPGNLRLLCPNCDSQLPTRGGRNKGRVQVSPGGYGIKRADGKLDYTLPADPEEYSVAAPPAALLADGRQSPKRGRRTTG